MDFIKPIKVKINVCQSCMKNEKDIKEISMGMLSFWLCSSCRERLRDILNGNGPSSI